MESKYIVFRLKNIENDVLSFYLNISELRKFFSDDCTGRKNSKSKWDNEWCRCECYNGVRNTTGRRVRRSFPECYNVVRNTTGRKVRGNCPKGGSVEKKTHDLVCIRE